MRYVLWIVTVAATAYFFAWAETFLYVNSAAKNNVWYIDMPRMLSLRLRLLRLVLRRQFPERLPAR